MRARSGGRRPLWLLGAGDAMTHSLARCAGTPCPIHAPSRHHMTDWPMTLRASGLTERICSHGVGHPDPDSVAWLDSHGRTGYGLHGCDGCCQETAS